jgi:predicted permease
MWIEGSSYVVAGVMPERFWFSTTDSAIWILLEPGAGSRETRVEVVARRQAGVTAAGLSVQLHSGVAAYVAGLAPGERDVRLAVAGIEGTPISRAVAVALPWVLAVAVLLTLLIACANVAILVIAQWTIREHEIAIRASLGASRGRVVRALLAESVVIAALGGTLGVGVTLALIRIIVANAGGDVRFFDVSIEPHILVEAMLITVMTGIVSGIGPAWLETRRLHANPMRTLMTSDRVRQRWRHALVVTEIAVTVALFVVAGGLLGSYQRQLSRDTGFNPHPLIALRVENPGGVATSRVLDAVGRIPGVAAVSAASSVPYMGSGSLEKVSSDAAGHDGTQAESVSVGPRFFATLNVPIRAGRAFTAIDTPLTGTAIVNELLATRLFPGQPAIGRQLWLRGAPYEVVGVVAQYVNLALQRPDLDPKVYLPLSTTGTAQQATFLIRAAGEPSPVARALRHEVPAAAPGNAVGNLYTLDEIITVAGQEILVGTAPLAPLVTTGIMLTAAGIYGVLAFAVARRSKELALRIAIGAGSRDIVQLVTLHSLRLVALGTGIGIAATFALSRVVRASGGGGSFLDPEWPAFVLPVVLIAMIGLAATLVPSRRALGIDPSVLLRTT